jgi:signal transduction histidine kinase
MGVIFLNPGFEIGLSFSYDIIKAHGGKDKDGNKS